MRRRDGRAVPGASRLLLQSEECPCFPHTHTSDRRYKRHASREEAELVQQMGASIKERQNTFFDMEAYLPKKNG